MPPPTASPLRLPLGKRDAVAATLIMLGAAGMIRHIWTEAPPEPPPRRALRYQQQPRTRLAGETGFAVMDSGSARSAAAEIQEMKRRLREFVIPDPAVRDLPVADALGVLQQHWQTLPHGTDGVPRAEFLLDSAAAESIGSATSPQTVSLEIPSVSLLTNLRLLAAQTGLRVEVTATGVTLRPDTAPARDANAQPANIALNAAALARFARPEPLRAGKLTQIKDVVTGQFSLVTGGEVITSTDRPYAGAGNDPVPAGSPTEVEATVSDDGYTIELNLTAEFAEFDGFINYGSPIQTTGINALGESEPVVLTDSKILQPVFQYSLPALQRILGPMGIPNRTDDPTGMNEPFTDSESPRREEAVSGFRMGLGFLDLGQYDQAQEQFEKVRATSPTNANFLAKLTRAETSIPKLLDFHENYPGHHSGKNWTKQLASFTDHILDPVGVGLSGFIWNADESTLTVIGSARDRRVVEEVASAIQESVNSGVRLELASADWLNDRMPDEPDNNSLRKQSASPLENGKSEEAARACRSADVRLRSGGPGSSVSARVPLPPSRRFDFSPQAGAGMNGRIGIEAIGAGFQTRLQFQVPEIPNFLSPARGTRTIHEADAAQFILAGRDWNRFDYRIAGSGKKAQRLSVFARCTRTTFPDE